MRLTYLWDFPAALVLLTRLPLPRLPESAFAAPARATWAYPLVGLTVGLIAAGIWWLAFTLPVTLTAGLSLLALILLTGALHEDGLADTVDGLWGGHTHTRRLEIMKDSRIGTYGVLALVLITGLRWQALVALANPWALVVAATVSRAVLPPMMVLLPQARPDGLSASVGKPPPVAALCSAAIALLALLLLLPTAQAVCVAIVALVVATCAALIARAKIGGITGDILGATQQITEVAILLALLL